MKLSFEPNLEYQLDAVRAAVDLFEGQAAKQAVNYFGTEQEDVFNLLDGIGNSLALQDGQLLENLKKVQERNGIDVEAPTSLDGNMHFSVEMETGTGKTYVYLRTIYELSKKYGFKKFVVVVPSIAIREGVLKSLQITEDHFQTLYDNTPLRYYVYDSKRISQLRGFATGNNIEVLVINIDAFAKDENVINRPNDKLNGQEPIKFIQTVKPIVIVDEPQNMESDKRKQAIANLNPLCTLRYSATHRNVYNLIYKLDPVKAYDLGLVKQIEVDSVLEENSLNGAFIALESIKPAKRGISAKVTIDINAPAGVSRKAVNIRVGDDLYTLSNGREVYREGYKVEEIDASCNRITLSNAEEIYCGQRHNDLGDEVMKVQIRRTIEEHLQKELSLNRQGIKVLSLFFIDRVANYRTYDVNGNVVKGKIAKWFEEIYGELSQKPAYKTLRQESVEKIHNGYFSQDKKGRVKDTNGETQADDDTYSLIMKDKEALLDINNPLRFIFSHTALREGWDNPNVFQICTLSETHSEMKKRQEIGRGLRLAVNQDGMRCYDKHINRLTVVANESYTDFAKALQTELQDDCGVDFGGRIKKKRERVAVTYKKGFKADPLFLEIWEKIKAKTTYRVNYNTAALIESASKEVRDMMRVTPPRIRTVGISFALTDSGVDTVYRGEKVVEASNDYYIPDVLNYIQDGTGLTRSTIAAILDRSGRMDDLAVNPQMFMDNVVEKVQNVLRGYMIDGIKYLKIGDTAYEMRLFEEQEMEIYLNAFTFKVKNKRKTIYDKYVPLDSSVETRFAQDCETSQQVKYYFKLPGWFKIPTPIGSYNPDWAVVLEDDKKVYFIAETKDTGTSPVDLNKLHPSEKMKIRCGEENFKIYDNLEYKVVSKVGDLI